MNESTLVKGAPHGAEVKIRQGITVNGYWVTLQMMIGIFFDATVHFSGRLVKNPP
ncbi:hypothetical protein [Desulfopila sp. IMCC35006]|uniref:hypothetical protein n=1 Tax=Desulfopila sp. IMCC35006 TaxID=2569542 RepID=UPI00129486B5|nr:hypothetical protein [Desulfopila sp. IMCC35006]